ncbi:hypothetical protein FCL47_03905 [Desulfopila sp. IMCC35006]|uniref:hypothetical protein n=1 Tax=Desulfopila sp. IMCC35006 TaxID=2569542 RepID=UPI0010AC1DDE|nr:hypothetical protein [Desulfopila sp. IMCC35006]TKB28634.1 hypothetical protein FCL47_03905 [Desulfopila sp. IMCC35006]
MNDNDQLSKQIEIIVKAFRLSIENASNILISFIERLDEIIIPIAKNINQLKLNLEPFILQIGKTLQGWAEAAHKWQIDKKKNVEEMAENGWYPNWLTFFYPNCDDTLPLDDFMINHLNADWEQITERMLELCPNRKHILENAFNLHLSGNYIAAIPLFLSQADGICCESLLKSFLFTENKVSENIDKLIDEEKIQADMFTELFLSPFKLRNHHNAGVSKSSALAKKLAPSRNGILHGHRKHLDYGTEMNSLKCFSLLSFVVFSTKEIIET